MRSQPAPAQRIDASHQANVYNESQAAYVIDAYAQVALVHMDDIIDGVSMHAGCYMVSPGGQRQIASCDASPHVDREVIADLIAQCIGASRLNVWKLGECKILVHAGHIG